MTSSQPPDQVVLDADATNRLAAAKLWLVSADAGNLPYLSVALYALVAVPTTKVTSMATDPYWRVSVNPTWLAATDVPAVAQELAHHLWHLLGDHAARAADLGVTRASAPDWKTATDATITQVLPWPVPELRTPRELGLPFDRSAEEYYAILSGLPAPDPDHDDEHAGDRDDPAHPGDEPVDSSCGSGCDGIARRHDLPPTDPDYGALSKHAAHAVREQVAIEFRAHQTRRGLLPGSWARWVEQILDPVVPWQQVLHAAVRRGIGWGQGDTDYTYTRISRRQAASGAVVLPALRRPVPAVAVVVDTSASVDDGLLAQALGEIDAVLRTLAVPDGAVTVLAVDAAVHTVDKVRSASAVSLGGGGGTDMTVGIDAAEATRPAPQLIVVLTDGGTTWPASPPAAPVIAALLGRSRQGLPDTPAWMQRVEVVPER